MGGRGAGTSHYTNPHFFVIGITDRASLKRVISVYEDIVT
jgi:hypothetical protein